jgi:hypothetical protein
VAAIRWTDQEIDSDVRRRNDVDVRPGQEEFRQTVLNLLDSLRDTLTPDERAEVQHLIDHNEIGEGLRSLLWIIAEDRKVASEPTITQILELADGLVEPMHLPEVFRKRVRR